MSDPVSAPQTTTVLTVAYDGAAFHGFARQPGLITVQGSLEDALAIALRREVRTACAGRTDAGVHAVGQIASFDSAATDPTPDEITRSINALVGPGVAVTHSVHASSRFDARHSALSREYRYRICTGPVPPLFLARAAWWSKGRLDLDAMREAAALLLGQHDFRSFCVTASAEGKRTVREIDVCELYEDEQLGEPCITLRISGRSFLHSMVRTITGTLVEVGRGRRTAHWVADSLEARDRSKAGPTAPAHGLTLWSVRYPDELWSPAFR